MERGGVINVDKLIRELVVMINDYNETGAIGYTTYKDLLTKVREMQGAEVTNAA